MAVRISMKEHAGVSVPAGGQWLHGQFGSPARPRGLVLLAHDGAGGERDVSSRVATALERRGFATLAVELLTPDDAAIEARMAHSRFAVTMLAARFLSVIDWAKARPHTGRLPIGLFGAHAGGAAALTAAALRPREVAAVISCSGPLDLLGPVLPDVDAPALLIVGALDAAALRAHREALSRFRTDAVLDVVPDALSLESDAAVRTIADLAKEWFGRHLVRETERQWGLTA